MKKMKKIYKGLIFTAILFIIFCPSICLMDTNNSIVYAAKPSINETMSKEEIMKKYYELKKDNQELIEKYNALNQKWADEKIDIESKKSSVDDRLVTIVTVGSALLLIFSLAITIYVKNHIKNKIKQLYENKINHIVEKEIDEKLPKEVANNVEVEVEHIRKIVNECKKEEILMENKKILLLYSDKEKKSCINYVLIKFNIIRCVSIDSNFNLSNCDIVLFNNECCNEEKAKKYKEKIQNIIEENECKQGLAYFYYSTNVRLNTGISEKLNFANSQATLYANLLNLLKFHDAILSNDENDKCI
ncbi:NARF domain-containing protein [Haloimpatiens sp. FM7330]|uniref:NARF domain-containing protein n=1 Tax=Haloimpatiens sp. FM7330 TaxID=3298610 RepID=UPI003636C08D